MLTFTYTKDNGEVSKREVVAVGAEKNDLMLVLDVNGMAKEDVNNLTKEMQVIRKRFLNEVYAAATKYGAQVKTFKHANITNKVEVSV